MTINEVRNGDSLTLELTGKLDTTTAPDLENIINTKLDGIKDLVLDMKDLTYVSSAGLRVLLLIQKKMNDTGTFVLKNVCDEVFSVLEITGFTSIIKIA